MINQNVSKSIVNALKMDYLVIKIVVNVKIVKMIYILKRIKKLRKIFFVNAIYLAIWIIVYVKKIIKNVIYCANVKIAKI